MSILCCQNAFKIIQNLLQNFWTWFWSPTPFWTMLKKTADLVLEGTPNRVGEELDYVHHVWLWKISPHVFRLHSWICIKTRLRKSCRGVEIMKEFAGVGRRPLYRDKIVSCRSQSDSWTVALFLIQTNEPRSTACLLIYLFKL